MIFTATEAIGFAYGVTWNTVRRNIFNWKHEQVGNLEAKVKSFCAVPHVLRFLKDFILFAEKEGRGVAEVHPSPAPDGGGGQGGGARLGRDAHARIGLAHPRQRQDLHDDQGVGVAVQGERGPKADDPVDRSTIDAIKQRDEGKATKVINLIKSIQKAAEENSNDPFLIALAERAKAVQEGFEDRQTSTEDALAELLEHLERNEQRKKEQAAKGLDGLTYFVLCKLSDDAIPNAEQVSKKVGEAFAKYPNWQRSEAELREVRKQVASAVFAQEDDMAKVAATVEALFMLLQKSFRT
jgi:type I restriction enzyme R subunit